MVCALRANSCNWYRTRILGERKDGDAPSFHVSRHSGGRLDRSACWIEADRCVSCRALEEANAWHKVHFASPPASLVPVFQNVDGDLNSAQIQRTMAVGSSLHTSYPCPRVISNLRSGVELTGRGAYWQSIQALWTRVSSSASTAAPV